jgi:uncharacterized protein YodC (DUF2158 family)
MGESAMTEKLYALGQVVQVRSGGPPMTVVKYDGTDSVVCTWMERKGKGANYDHKTSTFPVAALLPYKRPSAGVVLAKFKPY